MSQLPEFDLTQALSQVKRIAEQFVQTQFIAISLESYPWRVVIKGWAAEMKKSAPRAQTHIHCDM